MKFFEIILDCVEVLVETPEIAEWHVHVRKINKTRSLVGYMEFKIPMGNDNKAEYKLLRKQGGEYRYMPYSVPPLPFCEFLSKDKYFYPDVANNSDFPEDLEASCPLSPGNYSLYGIAINTDNIPMVAVHSGEYAAESIFYDNNGRLTGTYRIIYAFVNKV
ncbi:hypothetical protein ACKWTF_009419 [Chironomus riparius]